jgi:hypothetical protein
MIVTNSNLQYGNSEFCSLQRKFVRPPAGNRRMIDCGPEWRGLLLRPRRKWIYNIAIGSVIGFESVDWISLTQESLLDCHKTRQ